MPYDINSRFVGFDLVWVGVGGVSGEGGGVKQ